MTPAHLQQAHSLFMAGAVWRLGETVVSEANQVTSLWPRHISFPPKALVTVQDAVGDSNRKRGFVAGGWASAQLSPRTGDTTAQLTLSLAFRPWHPASGLGHLLDTGQVKGCSQPRFPTVGAAAASTIGLSHCHGPTVQQPQHCFQARKHLRRPAGG